MPTKSKANKKKKGSLAKRTNAANKDNLAGVDVDEILNDPTIMAAAESEGQAKLEARTGAENARIGMEGFSKATQNPEMFAEAMGMLSDPNAVKEAEQMMNDPEFKEEIQRYMASLKMKPEFQQAMISAQKKFQELMQDPAKLEQLQNQYQGLAQQLPRPAGSAQPPAPPTADEVAGADAVVADSSDAPADPGVDA